MSSQKQKVEKEAKLLASFCNENYQLSHIRSIKLTREIANGTQRRLSKWIQ